MNIVVIGATSAIATATLRRWAVPHNRLCVMGRNGETLETLAADLRVRGAAEVVVLTEDPADIEAHEGTVARILSEFGPVDLLLVAHGMLPDQKACQSSTAHLATAFVVNALSVLSYVGWFANAMEERRSGCIAVISSVAGDFGRTSNYVYGSAKATLNTFLQGLRNRLHRSGVRVVTIKPGFVDTPMTAGMKKGLLFAKPDVVAARIDALCARGDGEYYVPGFWWAIMTLLKALPSKVKITRNW
ncbi:MAG: SDR family NAD(P)-dependent oxidoreductase [Armatimonadota bacterium]